MLDYAKELWATKSAYIISLGVIYFGTLVALLINNAVNQVNIGIVVGSVVSFLLLFGPVVYIDAKKIRIKKPKPVFYEAKAWVIYSTTLCIDVLVCLSYMAAVFLVFPTDYMKYQIDNDTFVSGLLLGVGLVLTICLYPALQMIYIKTRYKRIVEFQSAAWRRHHYPTK